MNSTLSGIIDWNMKQLWVEGKCIDVDKLGAFELDVMLLTRKDNPLGAFEGTLETMLTDDELIALYNLWGRSRAITITATAMTIQRSKEVVMELLGLGMQHGILVRGHNSAWRVALPIVQERMISKARMIVEQRNPDRVPMSDVDRMRQTSKQLREEMKNTDEEETIHDPEKDSSVKENMQKVEVKPGIPVKRDVILRKKPSLGKSLVQNPKRR